MPAIDVQAARLAVFADLMTDDTPAELLDAAPATGPAYRALGRLMAAIPDNVTIGTWQIDHHGIKAQQQVWPKDPARVRANLRALAEMFGLSYGEVPTPDRIRVAATGVVDGVRVEFWEYVPLSCRHTGPCDHGVVSL